MVTNMASLFDDLASFNQDIGGWDVSRVTTMESMFNNAIAFNQDIGGWDVSSVTTTNLMFVSVQVFNYSLCWNVTSQIADQICNSRSPEINIIIINEECSAPASSSSSPSTSPSMDILNFCDCDDECCAIEEVKFIGSTEFVVDPANIQNVRQAEYNSIAAIHIPANNRLTHFSLIFPSVHETFDCSDVKAYVASSSGVFKYIEGKVIYVENTGTCQVHSDGLFETTNGIDNPDGDLSVGFLAAVDQATPAGIAIVVPDKTSKIKTWIRVYICKTYSEPTQQAPTMLLIHL